jgi:hypothetical protein
VCACAPCAPCVSRLPPVFLRFSIYLDYGTGNEDVSQNASYGELLRNSPKKRSSRLIRDGRGLAATSWRPCQHGRISGALR